MRNEEKGESLLLTVAEACATLRVGKTTLYELLNDGLLTRVKIGKLARVTRKSVEEFVRRRAGEGR